MKAAINAVKGVPPLIQAAIGLGVLYLGWKIYDTISNPEKAGQAVGAGAVGLAKGVVVGTGSAVKGIGQEIYDSIGSVGSAITGREWSLGTAVYDWMHPSEARQAAATLDVKKPGADLGNMNSYGTNMASATPGGETFMQSIQGGSISNGTWKWGQ